MVVAVAVGHGQPVVEEGEVELARLERARDALVVVGGEEVLCRGGMRPRGRVVRAVLGLEKGHHRHLAVGARRHRALDARSGSLNESQREDADAVEREAHLDARTLTPARSSWSSQDALESRSPHPRATASTINCSTSEIRAMGTSNSRASSVASPTSFRARRRANCCVSKSPVNTTLGSTRERILPWPNEPPRTASSSASGCTPAFTPSVNASATIARVERLIALCTSLAMVPAPIDPIYPTLPIASSAGFAR